MVTLVTAAPLEPVTCAFAVIVSGAVIFAAWPPAPVIVGASIPASARVNEKPDNVILRSPSVSTPTMNGGQDAVRQPTCLPPLVPQGRIPGLLLVRTHTLTICCERRDRRRRFLVARRTDRVPVRSC